MPIEIKELHIRVAVNMPQSDEPIKDKKIGGNAGGTSDGQKAAIVSECVEQVMQILQTKAER